MNPSKGLPHVASDDEIAVEKIEGNQKKGIFGEKKSEVSKGA